MTRCIDASGLRPFAIAAALLVTALSPGAVRAAENGGTVTGSVAIPEKQSPPPQRSTGFVPRVGNAIKQTRLFDPRPHVVVVLEGGTAAPEDSEPPGSSVRYTIIGESFDTPLLPVVAGSTIEIRNAGRNSPRLYCPQLADFVPGEPVGPKGDRKTKKLETTGKALEIRDRESAHLSGRVVAFPHRYFAQVRADGKFEIKGVAPGTWKVKIWFADGWVNMPAETIEVAAKREAKVRPITLPAGLLPPS